jgi:hypothetical protein
MQIWYPQNRSLKSDIRIISRPSFSCLLLAAFILSQQPVRGLELLVVPRDGLTISVPDTALEITDLECGL